MTATRYAFRIVPSPVGALKLVAGAAGLAGILWDGERSSRAPHLEDCAADDAHPVLVETARQLSEYFAGARRVFDLPLDFTGPAFNRRVWQALLAIPYGETRSYGQIARQMGAPGAARAVGAANGSNPIAIVVPCHRVVGADGTLTGFAGGMAAKEHLLRLESGDLFSM